MTVLPNAPIDPATGLPVPTIAVATDGGVSVIKDDGNVFDLTYLLSSVDSELVEFDGNGGIFWGGYSPFAGASIYLYWNKTLPTADDNSVPDARYASNQNAVADLITKTGNFGYNSLSISEIIAAGASNGLFLIDQKDDSPADGMTLQMTSSFNTGWMNGDIKGAFLSDTDATSVVGSGELVTNGDFASNTTGWTASNATLSVVSSTLKVADNGPNSTGYQAITTVVGKTYTISLDIVEVSGSTARVYVSSTQPTSGYLGTQLINTSTLGSYGLTFVANATTTYLQLCSEGTFYVRYDNVSVR
jgi:trimeric autotransporter adhesin